MDIAYKSYCWVMGTTSFRASQLNFKIERQLRMLENFWKDPKFEYARWSSRNDVQEAYYALMKKEGFVDGDAPRPDKDAREKTSGLVEMGLLSAERRLTAAGKRVLAISDSQDFRPSDDNLLELPKDSYCYFLQLLKATKKFDSGAVRPFLVFLHVMECIEPDRTGRVFLTKEEFSKLLPLCVDSRSVELVVAEINNCRNSMRSVNPEGVIVKILLGMANYQNALRLFRSSTHVTEDLICQVGMNRKAPAYDLVYKSVYDALRKLVLDTKSEQAAAAFFKAISKCSSNVSSIWRERYFVRKANGRWTAPYLPKLNLHLAIWNAVTDDSFRVAFFKELHLVKALATLGDYGDLNRRYFSLSDIVVFRDGIVELDVLPKVFAKAVKSWVTAEMFNPCSVLEQDLPIESIVTCPLPLKDSLVAEATGRTAGEVAAGGGVRRVLDEERYSRFRKLLSDKFPREKLSLLLKKLEDRTNDAAVQADVTDNADVPTIFEYLVALAWYYVSGQTGDVLSYMNLSLGADFLPKTHAGGGEADIVWRYGDVPSHYGHHTLLIEVTLAEKDSQRRMEMEPVSRHLGEYRIDNPNDRDAYCTFVTTNLNPNVISDFRGKRMQTYYRQDDVTKKVDGLKIIPIDTKALCSLLDRSVSYSDVYAAFERHYRIDEDPVTWYSDLKTDVMTL